jgi:hypothetical protein
MRILTAILILVLFCSCRKEDNGFKRYVIYQGNHYCNGWKVELCSSDLNINYSFGTDCAYNEWETISGWNKLYGFSNISLEGNHSYSCRLAWRWSSSLNKIIIGYYTYVSGERKDGELDTVSLNSVNYGRTAYWAGCYVIQSNEHIKHVLIAEESVVYYKQNPYFGGQSVAPHDMTIYIKENN